MQLRKFCNSIDSFEKAFQQRELHCIIPGNDMHWHELFLLCKRWFGCIECTWMDKLGPESMLSTWILLSAATATSWNSIAHTVHLSALCKIRQCVVQQFTASSCRTVDCTAMRSQVLHCIEESGGTSSFIHRFLE